MRQGTPRRAARVMSASRRAEVVGRFRLGEQFRRRGPLAAAQIEPSRLEQTQADDPPPVGRVRGHGLAENGEKSS